MTEPVFLPRPQSAFVDAAGRPTNEFYDTLRRIVNALQNGTFSGLQDQINQIAIALGSPDGTVDGLSDLAALLNSKQDSDDDLTAISNMVDLGLVVRVTDNYWVARSIAGTSGEIDVANGNAISANPTLSLADLADAGTGTFKLLTRDAKGRLSGTADGTTTNVPEGTNLYYTDARADARVDAGIAAHEAEADPHPQYLTGAEGDAAYAPLSHVGTGGAAHANAVAAGAAGFMTGADKSKLDGVQAGATANAADAQLRDRATHTGSQTASTISDFAATVRATVLTGLSTATNAVITAADTVLSALGKLQAQISGLIVQTITDGDTTHAPSGDAVFDALALKADDSDVVKLTGAQTVAGLKTLSENLVVDTVTLTPGIDIGNFGAVKSKYWHDDSTGTGTNLEVTGAGVFNVRIDSILQLRVDTVSTYPGVDNARTLGKAANRWSEVFAANGTINTSDAREKTAPRDLTDAELAAATDLARLPSIFQWLHAIEEKGDDARLHCSPTVQAVMRVMKKHGLDPFRYGFVCYDEWDETPEVKDEESGEVTQEYRPAGDRYSLRPSELAHFVMRGLAHRQDELEQRLRALEAKA